jgi:hypothetical protein
MAQYHDGFNSRFSFIDGDDGLEDLNDVVPDGDKLFCMDPRGIRGCCTCTHAIE